MLFTVSGPVLSYKAETNLHDASWPTGFTRVTGGPMAHIWFFQPKNKEIGLVSFLFAFGSLDLSFIPGSSPVHQSAYPVSPDEQGLL